MSTAEKRIDPLQLSIGTGGILPENDSCVGCRFTLQCHGGKLQLDCGLYSYLCVSCGNFVVMQIPEERLRGDSRTRPDRILDKFKCYMRPATADIISQWRTRAWDRLKYDNEGLYGMTHIIGDPGPPQHGAPNLTLKLCDECYTYWNGKQRHHHHGV